MAYNQKEIEQALLELNIKKGDVLNLHSSLFFLGSFDKEIENIAKTTVETILSVIGEEGTLVVPTFNFNFCKGERYHIKNTPSVNMGVLSEYVRQLPSAIRSLHPMHSVSAIGKYAEQICANDTASAFGKEGAYHQMLKLDAKLLLYGISVKNGASFAHYVEEDVAVPYRYWKSFTGPYFTGESFEQKEYKMYVRDLEANPIIDISLLEPVLLKEKILKQVKLGRGKVSICTYKDFYNTAKKELIKDPYFLVKNKEDVLNINRT